MIPVTISVVASKGDDRREVSTDEMTPDQLMRIAVFFFRESARRLQLVELGTQL